MQAWLPFICFGLSLAVVACSPACSTTSLAQIRDPTGITFKVDRTDCDLIAKDSSVSITAARENERGSSLLLKYDPWTDELPQVHVGSGNTIFIHIPKVSSILEQQRTWGAFKVKITIDNIAYSNQGLPANH